MKNSKTWHSTRYPNIYRHKSGTYYVRISFGSKHSWRSLRTKLLEVARHKAEETIREFRQAQEQADAAGQIQPNVTVGELIKLRMLEVERDTSIKPATHRYWGEIYTALKRSWPGLEKKLAKSVKTSECADWAKRYSRQVSASRFNNTIAGLRHLFTLAVENGVRYTNPADKLKRRKLPQKDLSSRLPTKEQFQRWVQEIRSAGSRHSPHCGDFVEFLAYSGLRVGEARHVTWKHCNFERGELLVVGDPETGTKNSERRRVPMNDALRQLLLKIKADHAHAKPDDAVCIVKEAQKSMDRAGEAVGMERITHHDLRHLFATTCIESGVDIPTVAGWLGHKDRGVLAMKTYGHLRNEHSLASAKKVSFAA